MAKKASNFIKKLKQLPQNYTYLEVYCTDAQVVRARGLHHDLVPNINRTIVDDPTGAYLCLVPQEPFK